MVVSAPTSTPTCSGKNSAVVAPCALGGLLFLSIPRCLYRSPVLFGNFSFLLVVVYHQRQDARTSASKFTGGGGEFTQQQAYLRKCQVWQVISMLLTAIMAYLKAVTDRNWRPPSPVKAKQGPAAEARARRLGECGMGSKSKDSGGWLAGVEQFLRNGTSKPKG
jgi:hypothetical protein